MWAQVILVLGLSATALSIHLGMCPEPKLDKAFDLEKFTGTWYLVEVTHNSMEALPKNCSQFLIENITDTEASVNHKFKSRITKKWDSEFFEFSVDDKEHGLLKFNVINGSKDTVPFHKKFPLRVVDTDYDTYAILLACQDFVFFTRQDLYVIARAKSLDDEEKAEIYRILNQKNLLPDPFRQMDHFSEECREDE